MNPLLKISSLNQHHHNNIDAFKAFSEGLLDCAARISDLHIKTARDYLDAASFGSQVIADPDILKNPVKKLAHHRQLGHGLLEVALGYVSHMQDIGFEARAAFLQAALARGEAARTAVGDAMIDAAEEMACDPVKVGKVKSFVGAQASAYDFVRRNGLAAEAILQKQVKAATDSASKAILNLAASPQLG